MSKTQVLILWIIAALLGAAVATIKINSSKGSDAVTALKRGDKLVAKFPAREVAMMKVTSADRSVTVRNSESGWVVEERDNYPANNQLLGDFLTSLMDVEVSQALEAGPSYDQRFGMDATSKQDEDYGIRVVFHNTDGKELASLSLGKAADSGDDADPMARMMGGGRSGRFVRVSSDPESVYVIGESFPRVTADPKTWLSEQFLEIKKIESILLRAPGDDSVVPWQLTRENETAEFTLADLGPAEEMQGAATSPLKNLFSFARFEDVMSEEAAGQMRDTKQARQAIITTFDGFTYTIDFAPKVSTPPAEGEEAAPAAGNDNYLLTVKVTAEIPAKRTPGKDEKPEDATRLDEEFTAMQEGLKKALAGQQQLQGRVYEITKWTVNSLIKTRDELAQAKAEEAVPPPVPGLPNPNPNPPMLQPNPTPSGGAVVTPPVVVPEEE
jgi:hypothetical protein